MTLWPGLPCEYQNDFLGEAPVCQNGGLPHSCLLKQNTLLVQNSGPKSQVDILDFILKQWRGGGPGAEKPRNLVLGGLAQCVEWLLSSEEE